MTRKRLIRNVLGVSLLSIVLLIGCGNSEQSVEISSQEGSSTIDATAESSTNVAAEIAKTSVSEDQKDASGDVEDTPSNSALTDENTSSSTIVDEEETEKPLELPERGYYLHAPTGSEKIYVDYCAKIYNPNTSIAFEFPVLQCYIENSEGTILANSSITGAYVMPQDSVVLCSMFTLSADAEVDANTKIHYDISSSDTVSSEALYIPRSTDFDISNVSEQHTDYNTAVTGKITNNFGEDINSISLTAVFKKDDKIVGVANTYLSNLIAGKATAFEIDGYGDMPEHDEVEVSAQYWY